MVELREEVWGGWGVCGGVTVNCFIGCFLNQIFWVLLVVWFKVELED